MFRACAALDVSVRECTESSQRSSILCADADGDATDAAVVCLAAAAVATCSRFARVTLVFARRA